MVAISSIVDVVLVGTNIANLLSLSTTMKMALWPLFTIGSRIVKPIEILSKDLIGIGKGCNSLASFTYLTCKVDSPSNT